MNSRKDYIEFVDMLGKFKAMVGTDTAKIDEQSQQAIQSYIGFFVSELCRYFKRDNPKFDEAYFIKELNRLKDSWTKYFLQQQTKDDAYIEEQKEKEYIWNKDEKENLKLMDMEDGTRKL